MKIALVLFAFIALMIGSDTYFYSNGKKQELQPIQNTNKSLRSHNLDRYDFYINANGEKVGIDDTPLVKLYDRNNIDLYVKESDFVIAEEVWRDIFLLKVKDKSLTIKTANELYNKPDI